jgi:hypothetical protein
MDLTPRDIAGVGAIYGAGLPSGNSQICPSHGCLKATYAKLGTNLDQFAIRFQVSGKWLKPTDTAGAEVQTYIGTWERIRFLPAGNAPSDGVLHYGDVVYVVDRWGKGLSARSDREVEMKSTLGSTEKWIIETRDGATFPLGAQVLINAPLRLASQQFGWRITESNGNVLLTSATSVSELRINGPLYIQ